MASRQVGLLAPWIVRPTKIATIETEEAGLLGRVPKTLIRQIPGAVARNLALPSVGLSA